MNTVVGLLFSPAGTIGRRSYALVGLLAFAVKYNIDRAIGSAAGVAWTPLSYVLPFGSPVALALLDIAQYRYLAILTAVSLPFVWIGIVTTIKRLRAVRWPVWLAVLFFVPVANVIVFALLCAVRDASDQGRDVAEPRMPLPIARWIPSDPFGAIAASIVTTAAVGVLLLWLGTLVFQDYAWGVFVGIPFCQGAIAALFAGAHAPANVGRCVGAALASVLLTGLVALAVALEGALCILMALPLALALAILGGIVGYALQSRRPALTDLASSVTILLLSAPTLMAGDALGLTQPPLLTVTTSVIISAPAETVWRRVIAFPPLPAPDQALFRLGVAYPERARIVGKGPGATRYCDFSTGSFVEPIVAWDEPRRLRFDVIANPAAMRELSWRPDLTTPHLSGFLQAQEGEFEFIPVSPTQTRLVGTTWYTDRLWPQQYWRIYSDAIIHRIHDRVLEHIKSLAEGDADLGRAGRP